MARNIIVTNETTILCDSEVSAAVAACDKQIQRDFTPAWELTGSLTFQRHAPPGVETIHVIDDATQADALGYHDLLAGSIPVGFVFVKTAKKYGEHWSATLSHEALEQLADPFCVGLGWVSNWQKKGPAALAWEVADAVENDEYMIDGVPVSNFVLPEWFSEMTRPGQQVDYLHLLHAPLTLSKGGYTSFTRDLRRWQEVFGREAPRHQRKPHAYGRRLSRASRK